MGLLVRQTHTVEDQESCSVERDLLLLVATMSAASLTTAILLTLIPEASRSLQIFILCYVLGIIAAGVLLVAILGLLAVVNFIVSSIVRTIVLTTHLAIVKMPLLLVAVLVTIAAPITGCYRIADSTRQALLRVLEESDSSARRLRLLFPYKREIISDDQYSRCVHLFALALAAFSLTVFLGITGPVAFAAGNAVRRALVRQLRNSTLPSRLSFRVRAYALDNVLASFGALLFAAATATTVLVAKLCILIAKYWGFSRLQANMKNFICNTALMQLERVEALVSLGYTFERAEVHCTRSVHGDFWEIEDATIVAYAFQLGYALRRSNAPVQHLPNVLPGLRERADRGNDASYGSGLRRADELRRRSEYSSPVLRESNLRLALSLDSWASRALTPFGRVLTREILPSWSAENDARIAKRTINVVVAVLPATARARYAEEFECELFELAPEEQRLYCRRLLFRSLTLAAALRLPKL